MNMMKGSMGYGGKAGAGAYAQVGVESGVISASPHRLIEMLFEGIQMQLRKARLFIEQGDVPGKAEAISRSLDIVDRGLLAALDREKGGEVAENLAQLYDYVGRLLIEVNLRNDLDKLAEASRLLNDVATAWRELGSEEDAQNEQGAARLKEAAQL